MVKIPSREEAINQIMAISPFAQAMRAELLETLPSRNPLTLGKDKQSALIGAEVIGDINGTEATGNQSK